MITRTLDVQEVSAKLPFLFEQPDKTSDPIWITRKNAIKPFAVVMEYDAFEEMKRSFYRTKLNYLSEWLEKAEEQWDNKRVRQACIKVWQDNVESLWELAPRPVKSFCASLVLSVRLLDLERFTAAQVAALNYCISVLSNSAPKELEFEEAHRRLTRSRIPAMIGLDNVTIQSYLDEE